MLTYAGMSFMPHPRGGYMKYICESPSGNSYTLSLDPNWKGARCSCPGAIHHHDRVCKHVRAFNEMMASNNMNTAVAVAAIMQHETMDNVSEEASEISDISNTNRPAPVVSDYLKKLGF
jgi:hypothetical protein